MTTTPRGPRAAWDHLPDTLTWTEALSQAVQNAGSDLLLEPQDIVDYCPAYSELEDSGRRDFWVYLISLLARYESNFNPDVSYRESFNDRHGNPVISRGLLQLSIESARGYGCPFDAPEQLHEPTRNLACGVRILARWVGRDRVISARDEGRWRGAARYWSPFRHATRRAEIAEATAKWSRCSRTP